MLAKECQRKDGPKRRGFNDTSALVYVVARWDTMGEA